ncbi:hypothetical protein VOLCADRAFT_86884 [Volvox carteri f. nagariensis]|uniref:Uncharacterized protein n=1 Tax=Volvox carteri f. nagariensis TaxID=3068 RepID=D8TKL7_VOLCA|nr:uncharacterized protein VOLCADRAFT_86884 [Volvox carteri f. nagariensis]EFJ52085.1 hypothetical protein VOLCADRAFT_86884 [Volvox carteri f. nagariensis]|eukprot:XP_002946859.1 hypothetical protein VOLCADRAFT_86884 [Volvox carteri f. nagariensis]
MSECDTSPSWLPMKAPFGVPSLCCTPSIPQVPWSLEGDPVFSVHDRDVHTTFPPWLHLLDVMQRTTMPSPAKDDTMADEEMDQAAMMKFIYQKISLMDGLNSRVAGLETSVSGLDNRLKVMEERISSSAAAGFSGRHETGNDSAAFHEDKVLARVPKKLVDEESAKDSRGHGTAAQFNGML